MLLYFHAHMLLKECMPTKLECTECSYNSGMRLGFVAQMVSHDWNACQYAAGLGSLHIALQPYMLYNTCTVLLEAIGSRKERCVRQLQRSCYVGRDRAVLPSDTAWH